MGTGNIFWRQMEMALRARKEMITVRTQTKLLHDLDGRVIGAKISTMQNAPLCVRYTHTMAHYVFSDTIFSCFHHLLYGVNPVWFLDGVGQKVLTWMEDNFSSEQIVYARNGV